MYLYKHLICRLYLSKLNIDVGFDAFVMNIIHITRQIHGHITMITQLILYGGQNY